MKIDLTEAEIKDAHEFFEKNVKQVVLKDRKLRLLMRANKDLKAMINNLIMPISKDAFVSGIKYEKSEQSKKDRA